MEYLVRPPKGLLRGLQMDAIPSPMGLVKRRFNAPLLVGSIAWGTLANLDFQAWVLRKGKATLRVLTRVKLALL